MDIGERIKQVRKEKKCSQQKFAEKINLSANFIGLIESGARNPSERTLRDISDAFNINLEWLKTGKGDMKDEESPSVVLEELQEEYNLDDVDIQIIEHYINMAPLERQVFKDFIRGIKEKGEQ